MKVSILASVEFNMGLVNIVVFFALVAAAFAEVVTISPCDETNLCTVSETRITPCKNPDKCRIKKGSDVSLEFDFTPQFETSKLETGVYWVNGAADAPFAGLGSSDGCSYTSCPLQAGQKQTFKYNLHVNKKLPPGSFLIKWQLWNPDNKEQNMCCFKTNINLRK